MVSLWGSDVIHKFYRRFKRNETFYLNKSQNFEPAKHIYKLSEQLNVHIWPKHLSARTTHVVFHQRKYT